MIVSRNEIETTCYRAALGAGLPFGLAEDAAAIGATLIASRDDGAATMLRALRFAEANRPRHPVFRKRDGRWKPGCVPVSSLFAGPMAADLLSADAANLVDTSSADEPAIIAICLDRSWSKGVSPGEISVPDNIWSELKQLAARTYVPASTLSRLRGAGAGPSDND